MDFIEPTAEAAASMSEVAVSLGDLTVTLEELYQFLLVSFGLAELGIVGIVFVWGIIVAAVGAIVSAVLSVVFFFVQAIPLFVVAKKANRPLKWLAWFAWIPVIGPYLSVFLLSNIADGKEIDIFGKFQIRNRNISYLIYLAFALGGNTIITALIGILTLIPFIGQILAVVTPVLYLIPQVVMAWLEYIYLRDTLDLFKPDQKGNRTFALIVAITDALVTFGLARGVCLMTIMKKQPLPKPEPEEVVSEIISE